MTDDEKKDASDVFEKDNGITSRSLTSRWLHECLFDKGFVGVPARFLELYAHLKPYPLTVAEAMFVLELMTHKWDRNAPYPSYKRIAKRMNVSDKMVRRYAQALETKKYLKRTVRKNNTNLFDLSGLFNALQRTVDNSRREEAIDGGARR